VVELGASLDVAVIVGERDGVTVALRPGAIALST